MSSGECEFLKHIDGQISIEVMETIAELLTSFSCTIIDAGRECPYTARYCHYKKETERLEEAVVRASNQG